MRIKDEVGCDVAEIKDAMDLAKGVVNSDDKKVESPVVENNARRHFLMALGASASTLVGCGDETIQAREVKPKSPASETATPNNNGTTTKGQDGSLSTSTTLLAVAVKTFQTVSATNATMKVIGGAMGMMGAASTVTMANGQKVVVWGLVNAVTNQGFNGGATITPGPVLEMVEGEPVSVTLSSMMAHTIHWHGLDVPTAVDGDPDTSGWVGNMPSSRVDPTKGLGSSFAYIFTAPPAGTYYYHCHVDTVVHMEMGMMGSIVVRPPGGESLVYANGPAFDKEYIWQLHTFDSTWHKSGHIVSGPANVRYRPDFFMINGMDGGNLLTDTTVAVTASAGQAVLIRLVNFGYLTAEVWLGGHTFSIVASDGRPMRKNVVKKAAETLIIGAGERYEILLDPATPGTFAPEVRYYNALGTLVLGKAATSLVVT